MVCTPSVNTFPVQMLFAGSMYQPVHQGIHQRGHAISPELGEIMDCHPQVEDDHLRSDRLRPSSNHHSVSCIQQWYFWIDG